MEIRKRSNKKEVHFLPNIFYSHAVGNDQTEGCSITRTCLFEETPIFSIPFGMACMFVVGDGVWGGK